MGNNRPPEQTHSHTLEHADARTTAGHTNPVGGQHVTPFPEKLGKYELRGEIGRGACGVVYKGFDPFVERDVAIKIAHGDAHGVRARRNFFAEARAAGMLQHPHIVALYDAGVEGELSYIVMEYIDGETLLPMCRKGGARIPLEQVVDIVFKCARALDYSHSKGVLHRDIKPSNVMLTRDGVTKIMDFSIAEINASPDPGGAVIGSPLYMSPEQVRREPLGPTSDLYSLGAVMFQLLTGQPPFTHQDIQQLFHAIKTQPAPLASEFRDDLPESLVDVVARLLSKFPEERFQSGAELATTLARLYERLRDSGRQISGRENRDSLRRMHFFDSFHDEEIDEILNASVMSTYAPGQTIISEGEIDSAFYLIALGSAEVRKGDKTIHRLQRGDCFGEIGFLTRTKRTASVVATDKVLTLKVNASLMEQVSTECQLKFYKVFTETLIYRLSITSAKLSAAGG